MKPFIVGVTAALLAASSAFAVPAAPTANEIRLCTAKQDESPDIRIANCTAVIEKSRNKKQKADAYVERAKAHHAKGNADGAISDFDEAIKLDPKNSETYFNRGLAFRDHGDADRAAQDLDQAVKLGNRNAGGLDTLSHLYYDRHDYEHAITTLNTAIKLNGNNALAF
ncbi:MAG TPA: tetratricopeptide repeat protein, partial [Paraburkholderia sp.]